MAFSGAIGLGFRHGALRLGASSTVHVSNTRLFSSLLINSRTPSLPRTISRIRNISSTSTLPASTVAQTVEETTNLVEDAATNAPGAFESLTDAIVNNVPVALQYGDMAALGLISWTPAGLVRWSMEVINVATGLPWFWTIVLGSAFWRLCCVPLAITGLRESARMQPYQGELMAFREDLNKAVGTKNPLEIQKAQLALKNFNVQHDLRPMRSIVSLGQLPITLGLFFGVQRLGKLPLEQLKDSGFSLLPDLTVPDPTYVLPLLFCAVVNTQISVGAADINTKQSPAMGHVMNLFRVLSIPGIYFMSGFPSALLISLVTTATLTTAQSLILRSHWVRTALSIPIAPPEARGSLPSFSESIQFFKSKLINNDELIAKAAEERRRIIQQKKFRVPPPRA